MDWAWLGWCEVPICCGTWGVVGIKDPSIIKSPRNPWYWKTKGFFGMPKKCVARFSMLFLVWKGRGISSELLVKSRCRVMKPLDWGHLGKITCSRHMPMLLAPTEQMMPQRRSCAHVASHQTGSLLIILSERLEVELKHENFRKSGSFCVSKKRSVFAP